MRDKQPHSSDNLKISAIPAIRAISAAFDSDDRAHLIITAAAPSDIMANTAFARASDLTENLPVLVIKTQQQATVVCPRAKNGRVKVRVTTGGEPTW